MNSWQQPVSGEPSVGTLHLFKAEDKSSSWDIQNSSPPLTTGTWAEADLSSLVPSGTNAVYVLIYILTTTSYDAVYICCRESGSTETNSTQTRYALSAAEQGASDLRIGVPLSILAPNGVFEYAFSGAAPDTVNIKLLGYYI